MADDLNVICSRSKGSGTILTGEYISFFGINHSAKTCRLDWNRDVATISWSSSTVRMIPGGNPWGRIHFFFGLDHPIEAYRLDWNRDVIGSDTPPNLLFIATTEGADDICIDLNDGTVYYWDAYDEDDTGRRLYKIADSFEQLLELLYRDDLSPEMD